MKSLSIRWPIFSHHLLKYVSSLISSEQGTRFVYVTYFNRFSDVSDVKWCNVITRRSDWALRNALATVMLVYTIILYMKAWAASAERFVTKVSIGQSGDTQLGCRDWHLNFKLFQLLPLLQIFSKAQTMTWPIRATYTRYDWRKQAGEAERREFNFPLNSMF